MARRWIPAGKRNNMELITTIFEKAGFSVLHDRAKGVAAQRLHYISNPDGSPRWVWPAGSTQPLFLRFYNITNARSWFFAAVIRLVFFLRLDGLVFRSTSITFAKHIWPFFTGNNSWALFTGTVGPNRKAVFYTDGHFIKVPLGNEAGTLISNEMYTLNRLALAADKISTFTFPGRIKSEIRGLKLTDISGKGKRCSRFTPLHLETLKEIRDISADATPLETLSIWSETKSDLRMLSGMNDNRLPKGMLRKLTALVEGIDERIFIETSMSHGDFTPWNMYFQGNKLCVYDWELARNMMPAGYDAFHFIIQQGILVDHLSWKEIERTIRTVLNKETFQELTSLTQPEPDLYLKLYLIMNTVYYLKVFSGQPVWHTQVNWLLQAWNEGLSSVMSKDRSPRELVLIDLFDFLQGKNYAALKLTDLLPEQLGAYSDLDLCIDRKTFREVNKYLSGHVLVAHHTIAKKSFMANSQLFFEDGSLLSVDLIWSIKRKDKVMMNAGQLLQNAYMNNQGIRMPQLMDNVRYIGLFYAMNNAQVPMKYQAYAELLCTPVNELDLLLYSYYDEPSPSAHQLIRAFVGKLPENNGLKGMINRLRYVTDTVRELFFSKGMVITFSGVDGAGKSTVIEKVKYIFDKKQRRKVVVIRHRPSLLPILSAWTKGREEAERAAASGLPRQGTNKGILSSLFRFAYYYCDYFFGQFYVYVRYVMRGYLVLYDRYYFDFINDPRRSNIRLPVFITRLGYVFLMKPDMNFFLFADPELIRQRKQELDPETITQLTSSYRRLFEKLDAGKSVKRHVPIENINLKDTLDHIVNLVTFKAA